MNPDPQRLRTVLAAVALGLATLALYSPSLDDGFLSLDDRLLIVDNPLVQPPRPQWGAFWRQPWFDIYMPLTYSLWAAELQFARRPLAGGEWGPADATLFHAVGMLLHAINTGLTLWLLRRVLADRARPLWGAALGAALFAAHPLQVQSVYWVTETKGTLCGLFSLLALVGLLRAATSPRARLAYALATLSFGLALAAKPAAVCVPLMAMVLLRQVARLPWRRIAWWLAPWLPLAVGAIVMNKTAQTDALLEFIPAWWQRPLVALDAVGFYAEKLVWPARLALDYGRTPQATLSAPGVWLFCGAVAVGLMALVVLGRRWPIIWIALGLALAGLAPTLGLLSFLHQRFSTVADRYAYLALIGPALALGAWTSVGGWWRRGLASAVVALLAIHTLAQATLWQSNRVLYEHSLTVFDRSWLMLHKLAMLDAEEMERAREAGDDETARRWQQQEAAHYRRSLEIKPDHWQAQSNMAFALLFLDPAEAAKEFETLLTQKPDEARVLGGLAGAYYRIGRAAEAADLYRRVIELQPEDPGTRLQLGLAELKAGRPVEAEQAIRTFQRVFPHSRQVVTRFLAQALLQQQQWRPALVEYRQAAKQRDAPPAVLADLAWVLATHADETIRNPEEALQWVLRAQPRYGNVSDPRLLDVLAAARAAQSEFDEAVTTARRGIAQAERDRQFELAESMRARLALYLREQPFRQPAPEPYLDAGFDPFAAHEIGQGR